MRTLGIDYGLKRVGLAVTDPNLILASPLKVINRTTREKLFDELLEIIQKENVKHVVVGLPLGMEGQDTETTRQVRNFCDSLKRRVEIPVELVDERLSSHTAWEDLKEAGLCPSKRKKVLDSQAAVVILETWLDLQG